MFDQEDNESSRSFDYPVKSIAIFGPKKSGKTSLLDRLCENRFLEDYQPSEDDEKSFVNITLGEERIKYSVVFFVKQFSFFDNNFENFNKNTSDLIFVLFDLSDPKSFFQAMKMIRNMFSKHSIPTFLVGNKYDLKKEDRQIANILEKYKLKYYEVSLKNNEGIYQLMEGVGEIFEKDQSKHK